MVDQDNAHSGEQCWGHYFFI